MRLRVLTIVGVGTVTAVNGVIFLIIFVRRAAYAIRLLGVAVRRSTGHPINPFETGSSQDHANAAERCWLQGVALAFFPQVAGSNLTKLRCTIRPSYTPRIPGAAATLC